ncbi:MAG: DUF6058 family natural product biosynthesis protein [Gaiellales bacterium]
MESDADDDAWIRARYATLEELCAARGDDSAAWRAAIGAGRMPEPSYGVDGEGRFPPTYFGLVDEAGSVDGLRAHFEERFAIASDETGALAGPDELDEAWDEYLSGAWGRVLYDPTPESAVQANRLAGSIAELLAEPAPDDPAWRRRLGARTDALAALLREGCGRDRANGEPHPWDLWVAAPRRDYAAVLADPDAPPGAGEPDA